LITLKSKIMSSVLVLKTSTPKARKTHKCMFCGGNIEIGEKYKRDTCVFDGVLYDWVTHNECAKVASELEMYDDCDDGVDEDAFRENINEYVYQNHYDEELGDIAKDWQLPYHDLVKKILNELKSK